MASGDAVKVLFVPFSSVIRKRKRILMNTAMEQGPTIGLAIFMTVAGLRAVLTARSMYVISINSYQSGAVSRAAR